MQKLPPQDLKDERGRGGGSGRGRDWVADELKQIQVNYEREKDNSRPVCARLVSQAHLAHGQNSVGNGDNKSKADTNENESKTWLHASNETL